MQSSVDQNIEFYPFHLFEVSEQCISQPQLKRVFIHY
ncbi:hypothetical protein CBM2586_B90223 [Cupriavidus phytorum]|uniref:Uncharacterized protein n=1 Tax=Cupriavidus taiwanensis TaxID=164546 RepID=A0A976AC63_9BURK|nr:hypothetical protein CBM2586_B90223 [Cupriavidus taiwanensis]